jgi:hypothetical protein
MPTAVTVRAGDVRIPRDVRDALDQRETVTITEHDRSAYVILHQADYALVSPILERRRRGLPISIESLLSDEDFAILAMDDDADDAVADGIMESWND